MKYWIIDLSFNHEGYFDGNRIVVVANTSDEAIKIANNFYSFYTHVESKLNREYIPEIGDILHF